MIHSLAQLGLVVRRRRSDLGLSQASLAERAGVSRRWIYQFEAGKPGAEIGLLLRVLDALELEMNVAPAGTPASPPHTTDPPIDLDTVLARYGAP